VKSFKTIVAVVLFASVSSFAGLDLMVGGGLNMSNESFSGDYKDILTGMNKSMRIGFNAGANMCIPFSEQMGLVAGLNYETRGTKLKADSMGASVTVTKAASYLQIPILFSYKPIPALAINLGPELGIFLGGKAKTEITGVTGLSMPDEDLEDISTLDLGASIQVNYTIANMIVVGAGYYWGFLNTDNSSVPAGMSISGSETNNNIKINVGYLFHL
jgi:hypothetical protein